MTFLTRLWFVLILITSLKRDLEDSQMGVSPSELQDLNLGDHFNSIGCKALMKSWVFRAVSAGRERQLPVLQIPRGPPQESTEDPWQLHPLLTSFSLVLSVSSLAL